MTTEKTVGGHVRLNDRLCALLPCPFCGGPAETDYHRSFYDYRGEPGKAVAIYCVNNDPPCHCDMTLCRGDLPGWSLDEMMAHLIEAWNRRAHNAEIEPTATAVCGGSAPMTGCTAPERPR